MKKLKSLDDKEISKDYTGDDFFDIDDIVLSELNYCDSYDKKELITSINCNSKKEFVIENYNEVFKSIYDVGKEIFNLFYNENKEKKPVDFITAGFTNPKLTKKLVNIYNQYVLDNGYPFLIEENTPIPEYNEFLLECLMIYLIDNIRKWIFKVKEGLNVGYVNKDFYAGDTAPTYKFATLYNIVRYELINLVYNCRKKLIYDDFEVLDINQVLSYDLQSITSIDRKTSKSHKDFEDRFFLILQRSLILYIVDKLNGKYKTQYAITHTFPILNKVSNQYRTYNLANSLLGIAYNKLLLDLTASKHSYKRRVCVFPGCLNEFERIGKGYFCGNHTEEEMRWWHNQKYYHNKKNK